MNIVVRAVTHDKLNVMRSLIGYVIVVLFPCLILGCANQSKDVGKGDVITINDVGMHELRMSDFVEEVKMFKLETDSFIIGEIGDLCVYDSVLYFFDRLTWNVVAYDLQNQLVIRSVNNRGNGPFEYVRPHALSVDSDYLYMLDSSVRKIICYDHLLEPKKEIDLDFTAFDFMKVENGFLLCTVLPEPSLDYHKIIYVSQEGKVKDSYIHTHQYGMTLGKNFIGGKDGITYLTIPYSNQIYCWENGKLSGYCYTDYGKLNIPEDDEVEDLGIYDSDYIYNNNFFVTSSYLINAFLYKDRIRYHFKENGTGHSYCGIVRDELNGYPFFPRWQWGDSLIGLCRLEEIYQENKESKDDMEGLVALFFKIRKI